MVRATVREPVLQFKGGAVPPQDEPFLNHKMTNRRGQAHLQACLAACIELLCPAPRTFPTSSFGNSSSHPPPQVSSYDARRGCREGTFYSEQFLCAAISTGRNGLSADQSTFDGRIIHVQDPPQRSRGSILAESKNHRVTDRDLIGPEMLASVRRSARPESRLNLAQFMRPHARSSSVIQVAV
jgi:hypothetical protein